MISEDDARTIGTTLAVSTAVVVGATVIVTSISTSGAAMAASTTVGTSVWSILEFGQTIAITAQLSLSMPGFLRQFAGGFGFLLGALSLSPISSIIDGIRTAVDSPLPSQNGTAVGTDSVIPNTNTRDFTNEAVILSNRLLEGDMALRDTDDGFVPGLVRFAEVVGIHERDLFMTTFLVFLGISMLLLIVYMVFRCIARRTIGNREPVDVAKVMGLRFRGAFVRLFFLSYYAITYTTLFQVSFWNSDHWLFAFWAVVMLALWVVARPAYLTWNSVKIIDKSPRARIMFGPLIENYLYSKRMFWVIVILNKLFESVCIVALRNTPIAQIVTLLSSEVLLLVLMWKIAPFVNRMMKRFHLAVTAVFVCNLLIFLCIGLISESAELARAALSYVSMCLSGLFVALTVLMVLVQLIPRVRKMCCRGKVVPAPKAVRTYGQAT